ncbi:MAG: hypothetical protein NT082_02100 [Chloroflexi bacterium]|nr:hypothetical protein [Chloroflexota bacterium]
MEKPWRSLTAGVLDIVAGAGMLFVCFWLILAGGITSVISDVPQWLPGMMFSIASTLAVVAILAGIGGIFAIKRKVWGLALAGAIATFICCFLFGIISIILTAISKDEFK